ncbi:MAG: ATP-binding cassette domain-containing protein [bacterium]|nr:ATP-binding cassette domain-containing protein [bacterium]
MIIRVKDLTKSFQVKEKEAGFKSSFKRMFSATYKEVRAVDNISFNVEEGEVLAFIGPNGAGKSTTIKMMTGILSRTGGDMSVLDLDPAKHRTQLAFHIGSVFGQKSQLWFHLPPIDSFNLFSHLYELDQAAYQERLKFLVDAFAIEKYIKTPVRKLSLGERMRCEVVGSLLHRPKVVFLDEPTIGLDIVAKQQIREVIKFINEKEKVTIFLTSHDAGDIEALSKRTVVINYGRIIYDGSTSDFRRNYINSKTVELVLEGGTENFDYQEGKITERGKFNLKIDLPNNGASIERLLSYATRNFKLADINIFEPELEEIIATIYKAHRV